MFYTLSTFTLVRIKTVNQCVYTRIFIPFVSINQSKTNTASYSATNYNQSP